MPHRRNSLYLIIIVTLLLGLGTGRSLFFNIAYVLGGLFLVSLFWAWFAVWGISMARQTRSRRSQVGRTFEEHFRVKNISIIPKLWLEIRDFSQLPNHRASQVVPPMGARSQYEWRVETPCTIRGEFQLGPMSITSGDPFGLFHPKRIINASESIVVYPQLFALDRFALPIGALSGGEAQRQITQHITTNAVGVRDYVQGDSINRIHWKSTARRNKLIVKEFELDPQVDIWIFADFSAHSLVESPKLQRNPETGIIVQQHSGIPPSTEEYTATVGASLASYFAEQERTLGFIAYVPHREVYLPERGTKQLTRIFESLAVAHSTAPSAVHEMLSIETHSFARGTTLIIITSSLDTRWLSEAQLLSQRGIKPVCVFIDPTSFGSPFSSEEIRAKLQMLKIPTIIIQNGDNLTQALSQRFV